MSASRIATRYAEALFDLARERDALDATRDELDAFVQVASQSPALAEMLKRPDLPAEQKLAAFRAAFGDQFSRTITALVATLVNHNRGAVLPEVAAAYEELADDAAGTVRAEAVTAVPLDNDQQGRIVAALERRTGKRVRLEARVDPRVLAGVRLHVGDSLIDGSAAGRLSALREELMYQRGSGT